MKRAKICASFLAVAVVILLAACSGGMEIEEFVTVTISLGNSEVSRQLVGLGNTSGTTSEEHTYELTILGRNMDPIPLTRTGNTLTGSSVPTGTHILIICAYGIADDIWPAIDTDDDDTIPGHPFGEEKILRAIGWSEPVSISKNNTTTVKIDLYSATEVSSWEELTFAVEGPPEEDRIEIIILKNSMDMTGTIDINRPIFIGAEKNVTITRKSNGPFFNVTKGDGDSQGIFAIGASYENEIINGAITMDGGKDSFLDNSDPLIKVNNDNDCTIGNKVILQNNNGGGVFITHGVTLTLYGTIRDNTTDVGGGGVLMSGGNFEMKAGAIIEGNVAEAGGGVLMIGGNFEMEAGAIIRGNTAESGGGVAMCGFPSVTGGKPTFTMNGGTIGGKTPNEANNGGGVYITDKGIFNMKSDAIVSGNKANETGGGIHINSGSFKMENAFITNNIVSFRGGGVYIEDGTFEMKDGAVIEGNKTYCNEDWRGEGGGVFVEGGSFEMDGGIIGSEDSTKGNSAYSDGGGVYINGTFTMKGGTIKNNKADTGDDAQGLGGGVFMNYGTFDISAAKEQKEYREWVSNNTDSNSSQPSGTPDVYHNGGIIKRADGNFNSENQQDGGW